MWKFVFPSLWSGAFGWATLWFFLHTIDATGKPVPTWTKWQFLVMWILGTLFMLWLIVPLKRVFRDESNLYIANYQTEISVPFSNIAAVRENRRVHVGGKHPIIVEFLTPTLFGSKIIFIPTGKAPFAWPWQKKPHPIVTELQGIMST
jgi:hypothetical protein